MSKSSVRRDATPGVQLQEEDSQVLGVRRLAKSREHAGQSLRRVQSQLVCDKRHCNQSGAGKQVTALTASQAGQGGESCAGALVGCSQDTPYLVELITGVLDSGESGGACQHFDVDTTDSPVQCRAGSQRDARADASTLSHQMSSEVV